MLSQQKVYQPYHCFLLLVLTIPSTSCSNTSDQVHYVFPEGFRGAFIIYTEQADGILIEKQNDRYLCIIPHDGILRIKDKGPFYKWHRTTASFDNGILIPVVLDTDNYPEGIVGFWHGGSRPGMVYDFIGTKSEFDLFMKSTAADEVKPGSVGPKK